MTDCYTCDACGDEYLHEDCYDQYINLLGNVTYLINGWYGSYDGQEMCDNCWDSH